MADFASVLRLDPSSDAARTALAESVRLNVSYERVDGGLVESEEAEPLWEVLTESDSDEREHEGDGVACYGWDHDGCRGGGACPQKHAPDERSVRDQL